MTYFGYPQAVQFEDLHIGDVVVYEAFGGEKRRVLIEHLDEEIKNERSGFSGVMLDENNRPIPNDSGIDDRPERHVWGYTSQITQHLGANNNVSN
jgi:hypothetical protein